jgi:ADP-ribosylglycohydrolase
LIGLALGDALGAHVEFRPPEYLLENPVKDLEKDDHRNLKKGQVLCLHPVLY